MAVQVTYTIPPLGDVDGSSIVSGSIVDVTFTLSPNQNPDGSYTVIGATGTFETTQRIGGAITVGSTDAITGVGNGYNNSGGQSDNELFLVPDADTSPIVTAGGADFTISNTRDAVNGNVDFYDNNGGAAGTAPTDTPDYMQGGTGNVNSATDVNEANDSAACFVSGTLIRTARGDVEVERLTAGDLVVTAAGEQRPIRWLGHRTIDCGRYLLPADVLPVRIAANAFAPNRPARDLRVSPGHSICVDLLGETLMPAGALINGTSIAQETVEVVTYWHVELDSHDLLLAENLACESYLEMGNRSFFFEAGIVALDAGPDAAVPTHVDFCRPYHDRGPLLDAARSRLGSRVKRLAESAAGARAIERAG